MMTVKVEGLAALGQQLEALERDVSTKILRQAGRVALAPVQDDMRQHAGFDDTSHAPHMRDSIKIRSTTRGRAQLTLRVGPSKKTPHESAGAGIWHREAGGAPLYWPGDGIPNIPRFTPAGGGNPPGHRESVACATTT